MKKSMWRKLGEDRPLVTVLMPVWNCADHISESIDSILAQSYDNFELLVVNDCSTDKTAQVIASYSDSRIRVLHNPTNLGIAQSLLKGVKESRGTFIARHDGDDVCLHSRLRRQVRYMQKHPEVEVLGGSAILVGQFPTRLKCVARRDEDIKAELLFRSSVIHPAVIFRKSSIPFWYDPEVGCAEDYDLWSRLAAQDVTFANLALPVIRYRMHSQRTSVVQAEEQQSDSRYVRARGLSTLLGTVSPDELDVFSALVQRKSVNSDQLVAAAVLAVRMLRENDMRLAWGKRALRRRVSRELAVLAAVNVRRLGSLVRLKSADRYMAGRMILSDPFGLVFGLWYAASRKGYGALREWGQRSV